jgi:hypothetical protein
LTGIVRWVVPRLLALTLLILAAPLLLIVGLGLALLRRGPVFHSRAVVRLPVPHARGRWPTYRLYSFRPAAAGANPGDECPSAGYLLLNVLPGLINVLRGEVHFVGVPPRSPQEAAGLPAEWRALYLGATGGLISTTALAGADRTIEEEFAADAAYAAHQSWHYDLRMAAAYLLQVLTGPVKRLGSTPRSRTGAAVARAMGRGDQPHPFPPKDAPPHPLERPLTPTAEQVGRPSPPA